MKMNSRLNRPPLSPERLAILNAYRPANYALVGRGGWYTSSPEAADYVELVLSESGSDRIEAATSEHQWPESVRAMPLDDRVEWFAGACAARGALVDVVNVPQFMQQPQEKIEDHNRWAKMSGVEYIIVAEQEGVPSSGPAAEYLANSFVNEFRTSKVIFAGETAMRLIVNEPDQAEILVTRMESELQAA